MKSSWGLSRIFASFCAPFLILGLGGGDTFKSTEVASSVSPRKVPAGLIGQVDPSMTQCTVDPPVVLVGSGGYADYATVQLTFLDSAGGPVVGHLIQLISSHSSDWISPRTSFTDTRGRVYFRVASINAWTSSLSYKDLDGDGVTYSSFNDGLSRSVLFVNGSAPDHLSVSVSSSPLLTAGTEFDVLVKVVDANGQISPASRALISLSLQSNTGGAGGALLGGATSGSAASGIKTFSGVKINVADTYEIVATSLGLGAGRSAPLTIGPAAASQLVFTDQTRGGPAGVVWPIQPIVQLQDQYGNRVTSVTSATGNVSISTSTSPSCSSLTSLGGPIAYNGGQVAFSGLKYNSLATVYLQASDNTFTTPCSGPVTIGAAPTATSLTFTTLPGGMAKVSVPLPQQPVVRYLDQYGGDIAPPSGSRIFFKRVSGSDCSSGSSSSFTNFECNAFSATRNCNFNSLTPNQPVTAPSPVYYQISDNSSSPIISSSPCPFLIVNPSPTPSTLVWSTSSSVPTTGQAGSPILFSVILKDQYGDPIPNAPSKVSVAGYSDWCSTPLGGQFSPGPSPTPSASGVASLGPYSTRAESIYLQASYPPSILTDCTGPVNLSPGAPNQLAFTTNPSTPNVAGQTWSTQPVVAVKDAWGNGVTGATGTVSLSLSPSGPLSAGNSMSVIGGSANFSNLSATQAGTFGLIASYSQSPYPTVSYSPVILTGGPVAVISASPSPSPLSTPIPVGSPFSVLGSAWDSYGNPATGAVFLSGNPASVSVSAPSKRFDISVSDQGRFAFSGVSFVPQSTPSASVGLAVSGGSGSATLGPYQLSDIWMLDAALASGSGGYGACTTANLTYGWSDLSWSGIANNTRNGILNNFSCGSGGWAGDGITTPYSLLFSAGASNYVQASSALNSLTSVTSFSVEAWINTTDSSNTNRVIYTTRDGSNTGLTLFINNGQVAFALDGNGILKGVRSVQTVSNGSWHHLVGTWQGPSMSGTVDEAQFQIYIDGALSASSNLSSGSSPNYPLNLAQVSPRIGYSWVGGGWTYFNGSISRVLVHQSALSPSAVLQSCLDQQARFSGLICSRRPLWFVDADFANGTGPRVAGTSVDSAPGNSWVDLVAGNNGTLSSDTPSYGKCAWQGDGTTGDTVSPYSLRFDGSWGYVKANFADKLSAVTEYSVEAWVKTTDANAVFFHSRESTSSVAPQSLTLQLISVEGSTRLAYYFDGPSYQYGVQMNPTRINDGNWHHLVGAWAGVNRAQANPSQFKIYVDGSPASTTELVYTGSTAPTAPVNLGVSNFYLGGGGVWVYGSSDSPLNGSIARVGVYGSALPADVVYQNCLALRSRFNITCSQ